MNQNNNSLALLPNGFVDLLPKEAEREAELIRILINQFTSFGYRRVKPPLVEFEQSLLAPGPGERLSSETFRLMDPVTHRMLGVRSDITAQIARIVTSRLSEVERPIRLTYANDVLRTKGSQMRTERQFTQVGCELVGPKNCIETDVEICVLAVTGLKALDLADVTLDLTIPGFVDDLLDGVEERANILKAVAQRDSDKMLAFNTPQTDILAQVMQASGSAGKALDALSKISFDSKISSYVERLHVVYDGICKALSDLNIEGVSLTLDLLEQNGFEYHKALGFTLFSSSIRGELGRGGCYDIRFGAAEQDNETAKGFTLYMDTISKGCHVKTNQKRIFVSCAEGWDVISKLQNDGWIVVRGVDNAQKPTSCSHVYKDGAVEEIK